MADAKKLNKSGKSRQFLITKQIEELSDYQAQGFDKKEIQKKMKVSRMTLYRILDRIEQSNYNYLEYLATDEGMLYQLIRKQAEVKERTNKLRAIFDKAIEDDEPNLAIRASNALNQVDKTTFRLWEDQKIVRKVTKYINEKLLEKGKREAEKYN